MPEHHPGQFDDSGLPDVESRLAYLTSAVAELAEAFADFAAEVRRDRERHGPKPAAAAHRVSPRRRRGDAPVDRWLRAVKVALIGVLGLGVVLALAAPRHVSRQDCYVQHRGTVAGGPCWRPVAHLDGDGDHDGTPAR